MAFAPLILKGSTTVVAADVSIQVRSLKFMGERDVVEIPATQGQRASVAPGNDTYSVEIQFLQDIDATALSQIFYTQIADVTGTVVVFGTMKAGAVSVTNPKWTATALVSSWEQGGEVNTVGEQTVTMRLLDRPVKATA